MNFIDRNNPGNCIRISGVGSDGAELFVDTFGEMTEVDLNAKTAESLALEILSRLEIYGDRPVTKYPVVGEKDGTTFNISADDFYDPKEGAVFFLNARLGTLKYLSLFQDGSGRWHISKGTVNRSVVDQ